MLEIDFFSSVHNTLDGRGFLDVTDSRALDDVTDDESLDGFVLGDVSATVGASDVLDVSPPLFRSSSVTALDRHG